MKTKGGCSEDGEGLDSRHWLEWRACEPLFRQSRERMLEWRTDGEDSLREGRNGIDAPSEGDFE